MLNSQLEIIKQGQQYLHNVSQADYTAIISPNFISSPGAHIRHIIEHYQAIISGFESKLIDYDDRNRGGQIESSPQLALQILTEIAHWIKNLLKSDLEQIITLSTAISVTNKTVQHVQTSVARELVFAGSHAVHHYAMIAQIASTQNVSLPQSFGLAPSTLSFIKQSDSDDNFKQVDASR